DLGAYAHQDIPFERLVEELNPVRSMARNPLFQVMLTAGNVPETRWELPGLQVEPVPSMTAPPAHFDLSLTLGERRAADGSPAGLEGGILYAADLFDETTAQALAARLTRVLEQVAENARIRLSEIDVLGPQERSAVVEAWNATSRPQAAGTVLDHFDAWVRSTPDALAVRCGSAALSYGELEGRANR
ncbi:hypothetical protein ADK38_46470, partial [Streptomyces varsoviensis]